MDGRRTQRVFDERAARACHAALALGVAVASAAALTTGGCSATSSRPITTSSSGGAGGRASGAGGARGTSSHTSGSGGETSGGLGGGIVIPEAGVDAPSEAEAGPTFCGTECGPKELCDEAHIGLDDNCNGEVDEGCTCSPGDVHWCFEGDPAFHHAPGCYDGLESCDELGNWSACVGGVHAFPPQDCEANDQTQCHAISAAPFVTTDLRTGTGAFSANAVPGSESFVVACPNGVSRCPTVMGTSMYTAIQSGQYNVTYTKMVAGDANPVVCNYPLFVGAVGLRIELSWEHTTADMGVDLDLHVHQPESDAPWAIAPPQPQDCNFAGCTANAWTDGGTNTAPEWFPAGNTMPMPCNWDLQPTPTDNTCYSDPRGFGPIWRGIGMGCHNPRLDIDNIQCDDTVTDPSSSSFCAPENINIDYPPPNQWARIGVHYYYNHGQTYDVHPEIKVFCDGALSADLGPKSFYVPSTPVTFSASDGAGIGSGNRFWIAADVAYTKTACGAVSCTVRPIYSDASTKTPFFTLDTAATSTFAPPWPPPPQ